MNKSRGYIAFAILASFSCGAQAASEPVTYSKDIAPILWKNCASCHRPGEVGPFSLLDYQDAAKRAEFLAEITGKRQMPPWKAEPHYGEFHDARVLTDAEIATIAQWAKAGAPEGNPKDLPPRPTFPEGWQLGKPDLVLKMPQPFTVPAESNDIYRCFIIPIPIDEDRTVAAFEFRPGNPRVVHHAILYLDRFGAARKRDLEDTQPGFSSFGGPGFLPTGGFGAWAPGAMPRRLPPNTGKMLRKGSELVLQVHYHPNGKEEVDQSTVGIYFTEKPAEKIVGGIAIRSRRLYIPAGENHYEATAESQPLPVDAEAISVAPHMHYLGREMKVWAELPSGEQTPLVWIKDWDFNWQGAYLFENSVKLPKGTVIKLTAAYDNSPANPRNPTTPPKDVHWGEQTTDEMCLCGVAVVTENRADLLKIATMRNNLLGAALDGGVSADDLDEGGNGALALIPALGIPIPDKFKAVLTLFDTDQDGKLTRKEIEAMPVPVRRRVIAAVQERLNDR